MKLIKITTKIIGLGLISSLIFTGCQFSPPESKTNNSQLPKTETPNNQVDIAPNIESMESALTDFKSEIDIFNQSLNGVVTGINTSENVDFKSVNQASDLLYEEIKKIKQILATENVNNKAILTQDLIEIETLLASINKVIKPFNNGLDKTKVIEVQKYINFFPRRGISETFYGNFGKTTQEEIDLFLNKKIDKIDEYLTLINANISSDQPEVSNRDQSNLEDSSTNQKIVKLEEKTQELQKEFTLFSKQIKQSIFTLILIVFIFILLGATVLILIVYKGSQIEVMTNNKNGNKNGKDQFSEYQSKFQKNDQQFKQITQSINQFEAQFTQITQYITQIEQILIKQINQRIINIENSQKTNSSSYIPPHNITPSPPSQTIISSPVSTPISTNIESNYNTNYNTNLEQSILSEEKLLEIYHSNKINLLSSKLTVVSESINTMNKRREGRDVIPIFEENRRGDFWVIKVENNHYLLPRNDFKINEFSYKSLTVLFHCNNDNLRLNQFKIIKPATVVKITQGWELKDMGELNFY